MSRRLEGRVAVVTGAASGIGRATALLLADEGARVFVGDFDPLPPSEAEFAKREIVSLRCDVRSEADISALIARAVADAGQLDILVNNAGIAMVKQIPDVTEAEWDAVMDTNLKGCFLAAKHAIPAMKRAGRNKSFGGGSIINVSSNAGLLPRAHDPVYSTSKGALVAFTRSLALCHARDRIRVNAVCPGPVGDTRMVNRDLDSAQDRTAMADALIAASPLAKAFQRMITPKEVAQSVLYLASDESAMVTGTMMAIDGGKSLGVPPKD